MSYSGPFYLVPICSDLICSILVDSVQTCPRLVQLFCLPPLLLCSMLFQSILLLFFFFFLLLSIHTILFFLVLFYCILFEYIPLALFWFILILPHFISSCPSDFLKVLEYLLCAQSFDKDLWDYRRRRCHPRHESPSKGWGSGREERGGCADLSWAVMETIWWRREDDNMRESRW